MLAEGRPFVWKASALLFHKHSAKRQTSWISFISICSQKLHWHWRHSKHVEADTFLRVCHLCKALGDLPHWYSKGLLWRRRMTFFLGNKNKSAWQQRHHKRAKTQEMSFFLTFIKSFYVLNLLESTALQCDIFRKQYFPLPDKWDKRRKQEHCMSQEVNFNLLSEVHFKVLPQRCNIRAKEIGTRDIQCRLGESYFSQDVTGFSFHLCRGSGSG